MTPLPFPGDSQVKYWDARLRGSDPPAGWHLSGYDDSSWSTGWAYLANSDFNNNSYITDGHAQWDRWGEFINSPLYNGVPVPHIRLDRSSGTRSFARASFYCEAGTYQLKYMTDNAGYFYIDGVHVASGSISNFSVNVTLTQGWHQLAYHQSGDGSTDIIALVIREGPPTPSDVNLRFQLRADSNSGDATDSVTVQVDWVANGTTDLGQHTSLPAVAAGDSPWRDIIVPLDGVYAASLQNRLEISKVSGDDNAHIRNVRVETIGLDPDYGEYPLGFPYTADAADGVVGGAALLNDGGTVASACVAQQGISPYEYWDYFDTLGPIGVMPSGQSWVIQTGGFTSDGDGAHGTAYTNVAVADFGSLWGRWTSGVKNLGPNGDVGVIFRADSTGVGYFWYWQLNRFGGGSWHVKLVRSTPSGDTVVTQNFVGNDASFLGSARLLRAEVDANGDFRGYLDGALIAASNIGVGTVGETFAGIRTSTNDQVSEFDSVIGSLGAETQNAQYSMSEQAVVPQIPATWWFTPEVSTEPPVRMLQRDDGYGGSSPRMWGPNGPTSRQASARQGWANTYV